MDRLPAQRISLQVHCAELSRRQSADFAVPPHNVYLEEGIQAIGAYCEDGGYWLDEGLIEQLGDPDDIGNEHRVWASNDGKKVVKVTHPGFFGLKVVHRVDEDRRSSPLEYLQRWAAHNELFGDAVEFVGVVRAADGIQAAISQPMIEGDPVTEAEVSDFFGSAGWWRFDAGLETAYFDPVTMHAVSDTHMGNLVRTPGGEIVPIDLRVQKLDGALLDAVKAACARFAES